MEFISENITPAIAFLSMYIAVFTWLAHGIFSRRFDDG